ncbi:MAG TPA: hypothetical protein DCW46_09020 [Desulfotomaculum sp.]|nr:hypothetical protein [Desulfotomaculum sp.]
MAVETFAANTLIIPMEEAYQNNGMWLAYGLVYRLLSNGIPVKWSINPGKAYNGTDFTASAQDLQTSASIIGHAYTGGPFLIDSAYYNQALPIINAWQSANPATAVHRATGGFTAPVAFTLSRVPRIAVEDKNSAIMTGYLNAAKIPDSTGSTWSSSSPDVLTSTDVANGAFFGYNTTDPCRRLAYDIFLSPHTSDGDWSPTNCAELNLYLQTGGFLHATCHSVGSLENICGPFLTTSGIPDFPNKGDDGTFTVDVPDYPSAQAVPTSGKVQKLPGGSEQTWLHTSVTYNASTQVIAHFLDNSTQYDFMAGGSYKGGTGAGKIVYEGGHEYSTSLPYSNNEDAPYLRFVYDSIFFSVGKPRLVWRTLPANIPQGSTTTVTFILINDGGSDAAGASASITLAPWAVYNVGSASIPPSSIVGQTLTWNSAALAGQTGPGTVVSFTAQVTPPGTGFQSAATYNSSWGDNFNESYSVSYCASVNATPGASPFVIKTPLTQTVNPNGTITWTITAGNNGTLALNNVVVTDTLPAGITFLSSVPAPSSVLPGPGGTTVITWQTPQIPASIPPLTPVGITITLNATAPPATTATFENDVTLTGTDTSPASYSETASAEVNVINQPPTANIISPNGGELVCNGITITWTASDPDGDPLTYTLEYSADGGSTYTQITTGLTGSCPPPGPPYCSYFWDTSALPSGSNYLVRVIASDGELSGQDVSDGPFTIDNTPPMVSWVFPTNGSFLSSTPVTIEASASDNVGVANVQFLYSTDGFITSTLIGTVSTPVGGIYSTNWELTGLPKGTYQLRAVATDLCGKTAQSTITITMDLRPEVTLISPNGGEIICPTGTNINWTADDPNGDSLTYTLFYSGDGGVSFTQIVSGLTGTCPPPGPPYCSYMWDTSALPSGSNYLIKVVASDGVLEAEDVSDGPFALDNTPPTVNWVSPVNGSLITTSPVTLQASATDNVNVASVKFQYSPDGITYTDIGTDTTPSPGNIYSVSWNFASLTPGPYKLKAIATDECANSAQAIINVTIDLPPIVTLISPNGGEIICPTGTNITWNALDPNGSTNLTYSLLYSSDGGINFTLLATGLTGVCPPPSQCSYSWDTSGLPSGNNYVIKVIVSDGIVSTEDVSDSPFTIDNTPPTVNWVTPLEGSFVSGTVTLSATATDNVGVSGVTFEYSNNGGATYNFIATVNTPLGDTYATNWNTVPLPSGPYKLRATAADQCNNTAQAIINVTVDNTPPTVQIPSPPDGTTVFGMVPLLVTAQDNECLSKVELYIDGQLVYTEHVEGGAKTTEFIFDWDTTQYSEGPHTVKAVATDCAGFTVETENTYIVDNLPECFTQVLVDGNLEIPEQKPDIENVIDFNVTPQVLDIDIFNTIDGTKVTISGFVEIGVTYVAASTQQPEHFAHFMVPFNALILCPDLPLDAEVVPVILIEHKQWHIIDPRTIKKDIVLFVGIREK